MERMFKSYTLKHLSTTRWKSRHKAVKALTVQYCPVLRSLTHLKLTSHDAEVRRNATAIYYYRKHYQFRIHCFFSYCWNRFCALFMQSPNNCSQNQIICQQQLHFWRKLLISFVSWGTNSTTAKSTATKWGVAEITFKDTRIRTKKRFLEELSSDCRLETPRDRFRVTIYFAGCWYLLYSVANALWISTEHNWPVFIFFRSSLWLCLIVICKTKLWNWQRSTATTFHPIYIANFWRLEPVPALSSRKSRIFKTYWMSSWVWRCLRFQDAVTAYTIFFDTSRDSGKQWTQLLKAQTAEDIIFARNYVSRIRRR